ncbi:MAG TPA: cyclic nucleotide-binding domain-containing protein [Chloroflexi bacterium]|nr:cyclic nucleotide-binding domain-containing protein [Chloroflexota bacterium]
MQKGGATMDYVRILKQADIFYDLSDTQLQMVASLCGERHCKMGETIFEEQSASDDLYVIARGEVDILINPGIVGAQPAQAEPVTIATLRSGQIFGEIALWTRGSGRPVLALRLTTPSSWSSPGRSS